MKINEVTEGTVRPGYATQDNPTTTKYAAIAFLLNDHAGKMDMKDDNQLKMSMTINKVAASIEKLNSYDGPKSIGDIAKAGDTTEKTVTLLLNFGNKLYDQKGDIRQGNDAPDDDTDNEFDDGPSDDEIARQADDRASKRRR
tara:strand:- start:213 stop:638 length:426 start_codon:yes stop_codon:yes gene_type:complete